MGRASGASGKGGLKIQTPAVATPQKHSRLQDSMRHDENDNSESSSKASQSTNVLVPSAKSRTISSRLNSNSMSHAAHELSAVACASQHSTQRFNTSKHATSRVYM